MGVQDDFGLWERELREPRKARETHAPRESSGHGMLFAASAAALGCTAMIALGQAPLGVAGLVLSALILLLWRAGM